MAVAAKRGFTIVELLVVITIIGILMAMLFPALNSARVSARRIQCINNQRQLGKGILNYAIPKDRFPGWKGYNSRVVNNNNPVPLPWVVEILPEIDRPDLLDAMARASALQPVRLEILLCPANLPANRNLAALGYVVNAGQAGLEAAKDKWTGVFFDHARDAAQRTRVSLRDLKDGATNTILLSECLLLADENQNVWNTANLQENRVAIIWDPNDASGSLASAAQAAREGHRVPSGRHPGDVVCTFCDGRTVAINNAIETRVYHYLMTSDGVAGASANPAYTTERDDPLQDHMLQP